MQTNEPTTRCEFCGETVTKSGKDQPCPDSPDHRHHSRDLAAWNAR